MYILNPIYWLKRLEIFIIEERMLCVIRNNGKVLNKYASGNMHVELEGNAANAKYMKLEAKQKDLMEALDRMEENG